MNEADTRANLIDPKLSVAGWSIIDHSFIRREVICPGCIIPVVRAAKIWRVIMC